MTMQARHLSHDYFLSRGGSPFLDEYAGRVGTSPAVGNADTPLLSDFPAGSELNFGYGFSLRKRARMALAGGGLLEDQRMALPPAVVMQGLGQLPMTARNVMGSGAPAASTSATEIDALIRIESERMRAALEAAWRRHARALVSAVGRTATGRRLRAAESELDRALRRAAELEEKARQVWAECQAWMGVARSHEAAAAGLRATLDRLLLLQQSSPACEGVAEDARSCCFEAPHLALSFVDRRAACKSCGIGDACVLLLPCRHLCLCRACEAAVDACPVCAAAKNASLHVLVS